MTGFPEYRPLPVGCLAVNHGPLFYGSTQVAQFRRLWCVWNSYNGRVRIGPYLTPLYDAWGTELTLMEDSGVWLRPARMALAFDQDALPVIAFNKTVSTVSVRRYVSTVKTEYTFTGYNPVLFYNGTALVFTTVTDVVCLYLNAGGTALYSRFQRENFGVERLVSNLPSGLVIANLQAAERVKIAGTNYMLAWGIDDQGRQVVLRSEYYEPDLVTPVDKLSMDVSAADGFNFSTIVFGLTADRLTNDVKVDGGFLAYSVYTRFAPADRMFCDVSSEGGAYATGIVVKTAPGDKLTDDVTADGGSQVQKIFNTPNVGDKVTLDISADSGTYP